VTTVGAPAGTRAEAPPFRAGEEETRARQLAAARRRATGLLVAVSAVFVAVTVAGAHGWVTWVQAAAEASMVGGVADWFAVTALFRRPLGLPIPHTAVIVERKDQFGETLGRFVQENFLSADVLSERIQRADLTRRLADWLTGDGNAERIAGQAADVVVEVTELMRDEEVHGAIAAEMQRGLQALPVAPLAGRGLRAVTADDRHAELFDILIAGFDKFLEENHDSLRARFRAESPRWVPEVVDDAVFDRLLRRLRRQLHGAATDPDHGARDQFGVWLESLSERLETSPEMQERAEELKRQLLEHSELREWSSSLWHDLKATLRSQAAAPDSELRRRLAAALRSAGERLTEDPRLRASVDQAAESAVRALADQFHDELADLVSGTVSRWDAGQTARRLELLLGRDLQFIRINGTVVGALVGTALHAVARYS